MRRDRRQAIRPYRNDTTLPVAGFMVTTILQIRLSISNAFLVHGERAILVDTGSPKDGRRLRRALDRQGVAIDQLSLLLHTHGHSDHCGGTMELKQSTSAPVSIHANDATALKNGQNPTTEATSLTARLLHSLVSDRFPAVRPDILISDELDLREFGISGRCLSTPGHTSGSTSVLLDDGRAIVGDLMMGGWLGGWLAPQRPGYPYFADSLTKIHASLSRLLDLGACTFYVGHGGPIQAERVRAWLARLPRPGD